MAISVKEHIQTYEKLQARRHVYDTLWQDIARYILPSRDFYQQWYPGTKRNTRIFDTTGMWANEQLSGGLHSMLTNPAQRWFALVPIDVGMRLTHNATKWLDEATNRMFQVFSSPTRNFATHAHECYQELSAFGNACMYIDSVDGDIRFKSFPLVDCYIMENDNGQVDTLYRRIKKPAIEAARIFGEKTPASVKEKAEKSPFEDVHFLHVVRPRLDKNFRKVESGSPLARNKPFESRVIYIDKREEVEEGGYDSFPYQFSRFSKRSGEDYGFGPGGNAIHDVQMINRMMEVSIRGAEKMVDPPILVPDDSVLGPIVINPAGIINYRPDAGRIEPFQTNARPDLGIQIINEVRQRIIAAYYINHLNLPQDNPQMTATEVIQRREEQLRLLGPMLSRQNAEFTGPMIERVFNLMAANGMLPPTPPELEGVKLKIEYLSPIAQAQRFQDIESVMRSVQVAAQFAEIDPMAMNNFDIDAIVRYSAMEVNKVPAKLLVDPQLQAQARQQAAEQQQAQAQAQMVEQGSKSTKNLANAEKFLGQV